MAHDRLSSLHHSRLYEGRSDIAGRVSVFILGGQHAVTPRRIILLPERYSYPSACSRALCREKSERESRMARFATEGDHLSSSFCRPPLRPIPRDCFPPVLSPRRPPPPSQFPPERSLPITATRATPATVQLLLFAGTLHPVGQRITLVAKDLQWITWGHVKQRLWEQTHRKCLEALDPPSYR